MEEVRSRHKKELKAFETEKRQAAKKAKATSGKGKKGKEVLAALETEHAAKEERLRRRHASELDAAAPEAGDDAPVERSVAPVVAAPRKSKAQRKREKARRSERERERAVAEESANAGPSAREIESRALEESRLRPAGLRVREVPADGNCLYRAVARSLSTETTTDHRRARRLCADAMLAAEEDYAPFLDLPPGTTYRAYCEEWVGDPGSSRWGGQIELRALATALERPIRVYSADAPPLTMGEEYDAGENDDNVVRLSFHRHYYALGEHYNAVEKATDDDDDVDAEQEEHR